jgi:hypothetical protein
MVLCVEISAPKDGSDGRVGTFAVPHHCMSLLIFCVCSLYEVIACQTKLDSTAVEEAYMLGLRNDKVTAEFVALYLKQVTEVGLEGLHPADSEVLTPYLQIVDTQAKATHWSGRQGLSPARRRRRSSYRLNPPGQLPCLAARRTSGRL